MITVEPREFRFRDIFVRDEAETTVWKYLLKSERDGQMEHYRNNILISSDN
jgi:hypothetical protein